MFITQVEFRAFDRDHKEMFVTEAPMMEKALYTKIRRDFSNTALLQRVVRFEFVQLKEMQEDKYDMYGKRITEDLKEGAN